MNKSNPVVEILIVTNGSKATENKVTDYGNIVHRISQRLFVIRIPHEALDSIQQIQGVVGTYEDRVSSEVREDFNEDESNFVEAWEQHQTSHRKKRKGEGLDWDATGFAPPDDSSEES